MVITRNIIFLVIAIVLFVLAAILSFGWFGSTAEAKDVLGLGFFGLAAFAAAHV